MADINIGIDIGKKGSICIQDSCLTKPRFYEMPMIGSELDYQSLYLILTQYPSDNTHVGFEKLGVIFGTSKQTAFSMGHQAGAVEMACITLGLKFTKIPPKVWQKEMLLGITEISKKSSTGKTQIRDTKSMALLSAKQLFPDVKLTFGERATKPDDGLIDSLLIAEFVRRNY